MRQKIERAAAVLAVLVLLAAGIRGLTELTRVKSTTVRDLSFQSYFDSPEDYDVIFLGSSHVKNGVLPLELWKEYGVVSYNWATPSCTIPMAYWKLQILLDYAEPKLVVLDCFRAVWTDKSLTSERMHEAFDAFPLSLKKYRAVQDLMADPERYTASARRNVLFRFGDYHSRWSELQAEDFSFSLPDMKGAGLTTKVAVPDPISHTMEKTVITPEMEGVNYLRKIIAECQARSIPILLVYLPYPVSEEWKMESNMVQDIADEYGVEYINFTNLDVVNNDTDYNDPNSHLNVLGAKKVSDYLGAYVKAHYGIPDRRGDARLSSQWNRDYEEHTAEMRTLLCETTNPADYLMLAAAEQADLVLDVRDRAILKNPQYRQLLKELGVQEEISADDTDFILIRQKEGKAAVLRDFRRDGARADTPLGRAELHFDPAGVLRDEESRYFSLWLDGKEYYAGRIEDTRGLYIYTFADGEKLERVHFFYQADEETGIAEEYRAER